MKLFDRIKNFKKDKLVILGLIGLVAYIWFFPPAAVTHVNQTLPNLAFTTFDGRQGTLESLRGKVVVVNIWATWCPYCRKEMPAIQSFYKDYQAKGVEVIALSLDDDMAKAAQYLHDGEYTFPGVMADGAWTQALGPFNTVPMTVVIDRDGHLRHTVHGQVYYGRLEGLVQPLLATR